MLSEQLLIGMTELHNLETELQDLVIELKLMDERKKTLMKDIKKNRKTLRGLMVDNLQDKFVCDAGRLDIRPGRNKIQLKVDVEELPEEFVKVKKTADLAGLKAELESGSAKYNNLAEIVKSDSTLTVKLNSNFLDEVPF